MSNYDAILWVSFGGPEGPEDVIPFLNNVLRGRNVPPERMLQVAEHYQLFGGVSPINEQNRRLIAALESELQEHGPRLPIYWGNRNWHPLLSDTVQRMKADGVKCALAFVTSAYSSYSSCRQYRENIAQAQQSEIPQIDKIRPFYNHPLFVSANTENVNAQLQRIPASRRGSTMVLFTAHSIPDAMAANCIYAEQLREIAELIARELKLDQFELVYQSRSGSPSQPWLGPDVSERINELPQRGVTDVLIAPIGFISDHMEIIYDLDVQAQHECAKVGLNMWRAETVGTNPLFVKLVRELLIERIENREPEFVGELGAMPHICRTDCCLPSAARPAVNLK